MGHSVPVPLSGGRGAKAVQAATGLPCYDFIDVIGYMEAGTSPKSHAGRY